MEEIIRRSADLGAGKVELEGSIERGTAALRGEAESAEYLGLTLNEEYVKGWHKANNAHAKAWKHLSDLEKAQVRYQVLLEQSAEMQGRAADSADTFAGMIQKVKKEVEDSISQNENVQEAFSNLAKTLDDNSENIAEVVKAIATSVGVLVDIFSAVVEKTQAFSEKLAKLTLDTESIEAAQAALAETVARVTEKYGDFAYIYIPGDLTKLAQDDLKQLQDELQKSRAYWVAMDAAASSEETKAEAQERLKVIRETMSAIHDIRTGALDKQVALEKAATVNLVEEVKDRAQKIIATYDQETEARARGLKNQLLDLELSEAKGEVIKEEAAAERIKIEAAYYSESLKKAQEHQRAIVFAFEGTEEEKEKALQRASKEIHQIEIELKKLRIKEVESLTETQKAEEEKRIKAAKDAAAAIVKIATDEAAARSTALAAYTAGLELEEAK
ncbi:MAG: hypothetical protein MI749_02790, partial [Desulfovibrionales bacterium]|nr:hypothetical protein [Desulfovibrionales bacterium]